MLKSYNLTATEMPTFQALSTPSGASQPAPGVCRRTLCNPRVTPPV